MAFLAIIVLCTTNLSAQKTLKIGDEYDSDIKVTKTYQRFRKSKLNKGSKELVYQKEFYSKNSSYIKLYFKNFDLAPGDYLQIQGVNSKESIVYGGKGKIVDSQKTMISDFWSRVIFDDKVTVKLYSLGEVSSHNGFEITKVAYGYSEEKIMKKVSSQIRSICSSDNKERIACYQGTQMYEKAKAVCRLLINGSNLCTGWLLGSEGHLMTNEHCIGSARDAQNTDFIFNYQYQGCSGNATAQRDIVAESSTFIKTSSSLDYTLVKLPTNPTAKYGYLSLSKKIPVKGDRIYIPQHPGGRRKEISVKTDRDGTTGGFSRVYSSTSGSGKQVRYYADTEGGSSGSPVIDYSSNLVIAIHNTGLCPNGSYGRCDNLISSIGSNMPTNGVGGSTGGGGNPSCTSTVSSFPYNQDFENTLGKWKQSTSDDFNWAVNRGGTRSRGTGPSSASSGSYYLYMESSSPNHPSKSAIINSPCFNLSKANKATFKFNYHMYGSSIGNLKLQASTDKGKSWLTIWQKSNSQGGSWLSASVNLGNYIGKTVQLRFNGTTGSSYTGDIAIDKLSLSTSGSGSSDGQSSIVKLNIKLDRYPEETTWEIKDNKGKVVSFGGPYSRTSGSTITKDIKLANGCYSLVFKDKVGDGICCRFGSGSYKLSTSTGTTLASGGRFGRSETKNFCLGNSTEINFESEFVPTGEVVDDLIIFPNPVSEVLNIKIPERDFNGTYRIINLEGKDVGDGKLRQNIPVNLPPSIYTLEVKTIKGTYKGTFVKKENK